MSEARNDPLKPKIEIWNVADLKPYAANAKKHSEEQVDKLARLITASGWTQPIVVDRDGVIIAGHGRRLAALKMGLERVPVIVRRDLNKAEADALRLADNRVSSTEYDMGLIQDELSRLSEELEGTSLGLDDLGFDERELDFSTADLGEMNFDNMVDDIQDAVATQKKENEEKAKETDESHAPVVDALGFKRITVTESRDLRDAIAKAAERTGQSGVTLLLNALREAGRLNG